MPNKICVLGDGSWGTAIASLLANNGFEINLWCYNPKIAESINQNNQNNIYFPNFKLDKKIKASTNLQEILSDSEWIFEAIPVKFLREVLKKTKPYINKNQKWVLLSKGLEKETFFLPSQIINDVFEFNVPKVIISGPSFANDLIEKKVTMVDVSCSDNSIENDIKEILTNNYFKINLSDDLIGIQAAGALKNVAAILMGIMQAKNYADNTKAYIFTKCINEIKNLIEVFGGKKETILGLAGIGDLILTCFGKHSKNLKLATDIGSGKELEKILQQKSVPEGINTIESVYLFIKKNKIHSPVFEGIYKFIFSNEDFDKIII